MNILTANIEKDIEGVPFRQELYMFLKRAGKSHTNIAGSNFRNLILSFIGDIETLEDFAYFIQFLRKNIGGVHTMPTTQAIYLFDDIFREIFDKKRGIFSCYRGDSKFIATLFHNLRNFSNIPVDFFEEITPIIEGIAYWSGNYISEMLRTIEPYRDTKHGRALIHTIGEKLLSLNFEKQGFRVIQGLIINLEHLDIEIPDELLYRWNLLQSTEGEKNYISTKDEDDIINLILGDANVFDGFSLEKNVFICGYEVDIVVYDTHGDIFAIIESDGSAHQKSSKVRNKDNKRDALFLRRGITDTIIRCINK